MAGFLDSFSFEDDSKRAGNLKTIRHEAITYAEIIMRALRGKDLRKIDQAFILEHGGNVRLIQRGGSFAINKLNELTKRVLFIERTLDQIRKSVDDPLIAADCRYDPWPMKGAAIHFVKYGEDIGEKESAKKPARKPKSPKPAEKPEVAADNKPEVTVEQKPETSSAAQEKPVVRNKKEKPAKPQVIAAVATPEPSQAPVQKSPVHAEVPPAPVSAQKPRSWLKTDVVTRQRVDIFQAWNNAAREELNLLTGSLSQEKVMQIRTDLMTIQGRVVNSLKKTAHKHPDGLDLQTPLARHAVETVLKDKEAAFSDHACEAARLSFKTLSERFCMTARGDFVERARFNAVPSEESAAPELMTA